MCIRDRHAEGIESAIDTSGTYFDEYSESAVAAADLLPVSYTHLAVGAFQLVQHVHPEAAGGALVLWQEGDFFRKALAAGRAGITAFAEIEDGMQPEGRDVLHFLQTVVMDRGRGQITARAVVDTPFHRDVDLLFRIRVGHIF